MARQNRLTNDFIFKSMLAGETDFIIALAHRVGLEPEVVDWIVNSSSGKRITK